VDVVSFRINALPFLMISWDSNFGVRMACIALRSPTSSADFKTHTCCIREIRKTNIPRSLILRLLMLPYHQALCRLSSTPALDGGGLVFICKMFYLYTHLVSHILMGRSQWGHFNGVGHWIWSIIYIS
jgi:hypothetical protein